MAARSGWKDGAIVLAAAGIAVGAIAQPVAPPGAQSSAPTSVAASAPAVPPVTGSREAPVPSWGKPLPYPIVIADRRNNRLIEVAPDKRIVWTFDSPNLKVYRGNEDVNFAADGRTLWISEEDNYDIHGVDYEKRELFWTFGVPDVRGSKPGYLNFPDDAHLLADGKVMTADIRNCRILFVDRETLKIAAQWGKPGQCRHDPPKFLGYPNGATPMSAAGPPQGAQPPGGKRREATHGGDQQSNGDILVTEITGSWISRITREGKVLWSVQAPKVRYPSDAFPTWDGKQVIVADFAKPGRVVIFDPATRKITWEYYVKDGEAMLDHPSLARELPTGDVLISDDLRERVVVVDRQTKAIVWQYGVTDVKGDAPGYLNYPDGFDLDLFRDWKAWGAAKKP